MAPVSLPKPHSRVAQPRARRDSAAVRVPRDESLAAPLTLAAVVVVALMLALAMGIVTALGA